MTDTDTIRALITDGLAAQGAVLDCDLLPRAKGTTHGASAVRRDLASAIADDVIERITANGYTIGRPSSWRVDPHVENMKPFSCDSEREAIDKARASATLFGGPPTCFALVPVAWQP